VYLRGGARVLKMVRNVGSGRASFAYPEMIPNDTFMMKGSRDFTGGLQVGRDGKRIFGGKLPAPDTTTDKATL